MVNATVDNDPVSIVLDGGESTTVPSNETFRVSIHLAGQNTTRMKIDGIGTFRGDDSTQSTHKRLPDVTLTGGQTVAETRNETDSLIFITGFVVDS
jgi:hypothetical protein